MGQNYVTVFMFLHFQTNKTCSFKYFASNSHSVALSLYKNFCFYLNKVLSLTHGPHINYKNYMLHTLFFVLMFETI